MYSTIVDPFIPRVGGILSGDIAVPEHARELRFYSRVLSTGERPLWREDLMNNHGMPIIGLGARTAEHDAIPLQWMPHIQVADVSGSVKSALDCGGRVLMEDQQGDTDSHWAVLLDQNDAAFGIMAVVPAKAVAAPGSHEKADATIPVGRISWVALTVPNAADTCEFYRQVVGWSVQGPASEEASESRPGYSMLCENGNPAAGIYQPHATDLELPSVWIIHLPVGDLGESVRRVHEEGGNVITETRARDGSYEWVVVEDPVGACLALVQG